MTPQERNFDWTPVLTFATPGDLAVTYSVQVGYGKKLGRDTELFFHIVTSGFTWTGGSGATGQVQITGNPFTSANLANFRSRGALEWSGVTKATYTDIQSGIGANASVITFFASGSGVAAANVNAADTPSGGTVILRGTISFLAAG